MVIWLIGLPELDRVLELAMGDGHWLQVVGLVLMGAVLVLAVRVKPQFVARTVRGNGLIALVVFLVGGFVTVLAGATLIDRFGSAQDVGQAGVRVLSGLFGDIGLQGLDVDVTAPLWVNLVIGLMGAATVLGSAYLLFRAPRDAHTLDAADEARARTLLREFGETDSLGYFATRRDKSVVWDSGDPATARAGISYRVFGSVCLASGNPMGDPTRWGAAIGAWRAQARANGWSLAVMGAGEEEGGRLHQRLASRPGRSATRRSWTCARSR